MYKLFYGVFVFCVTSCAMEKYRPSPPTHVGIVPSIQVEMQEHEKTKTICKFTSVIDWDF